MPEELKHAAQRISAVLEPVLSKAVNSAIAARAQDPISHVAKALQASDGHAAEAAAQKAADEKPAAKEPRAQAARATKCWVLAEAEGGEPCKIDGEEAVSYTHLTLPTILLV